ncbi:MAG: PH domain-containing protein [Anaerolineae bacterium]|jgi:hypothetical protein
MSYVDKVMGDTEHVVYQTHQHYVVLLLHAIESLFAFVVFLIVGLVVLLPDTGQAGNELRSIVGLIALGSLVMPFYLIVSSWLRGLRGREFLRSIWQAVVAAVLILVFASVVLIMPELRIIGWFAVIIALFPLAELVRIFLDWYNERYIITNRRVMEVKGTINKSISDSALEKVNDVKLDQSIVGRVLGFGTVQIITGSDIGLNSFVRISNPVRFKREMLNAKERLHEPDSSQPEDKADVDREQARAAAVLDSASGADRDDIPDLLVELDELRKKGIISEEEFQAKKAELLARL